MKRLRARPSVARRVKLLVLVKLAPIEAPALTLACPVRFVHPSLRSLRGRPFALGGPMARLDPRTLALEPRKGVAPLDEGGNAHGKCAGEDPKRRLAARMRRVLDRKGQGALPIRCIGAGRPEMQCDDVRAFISEMRAKKIKCSPVEEQRWGSITRLTLPGGGKLGVYQPRHPSPIKAAKRAKTRRK